MLGKTKRFAVLLILLLLVSGLSAFSGGSAAAKGAARPSVISSGQQVQPAVSSQTYWTAARMKAARSADNLVSTAKLTKQAAHTTSSGSAKPVAPTVHPTLKSSVQPNVHSAVVTPGAYSLPSGAYSSYPYSTIGKVFFTDPQTGYGYVCSGAAVNSANLSVVDTAGHCVVAGGSGSSTPDWYTNWEFCPQYYYGSTPYGCWSERQAVTSSDWYYSGSLEDDFGDVAVWANGYGNLVNVVGGTGWAYGQATSQYFYPFGYPAASPFNGNSIYYCAGYGTAYGYDDGTVISVSCDMTGGSSGGPWLISLNGTFGYVNGHNDFKYTSDPSHMYSPYYDSDWYNVFNTAQNL